LSEESNYQWVRQIDRLLMDADTIPLFGNLPDFPWESFVESVKSQLQFPDFSATPAEGQWVNSSEAKKGFGEAALEISLTLSSISAPFSFLISKEDLYKLLKATLGQNDIQGLDEESKMAFVKFFLANFLHVIDSLNCLGNLSPKILSFTAQEIQSPTCFTQDISVQLNGCSFNSRLLLPESFLNSLREALKTQAPPQTLDHDLEVDIRVEAGKVHITPVEFNKLSQGDLLVLDTCSIDPNKKAGRVMLTLNGQPIFRGRFKDEEVKLLDIPKFQEVEEEMSEEADIPPLEDDDLDVLKDEEIQEEAQAAEAALEEGSEPPQEAENAEEAASVQEAPVEAPAEAAPSQEEALSTPDSILLDVSVEVAKLKMPLSELKQLQAGNLLDLKVSPEEGVRLVSNGKTLAKGELLKVGDLLGVRVLELAK
jgi:flagellar motor switch protein FliN